jgi:sialate O-acetylesterase
MFFQQAYMMKYKLRNTIIVPCILFFFFLAAQLSSFAQVKLPRLISDGMVLQRDAKIKIWGWAKPNEKISVQFLNKNYKTVTAANGQWMLELPKLKAGGPFEMKISGSNSITIKDVLIGDVWLASGQSNMEYQLGYDDATYAKEMAEVNFPQIRQFKVPTRPLLDGPKDTLAGGSWKWANPKDIGPFSAVAYFFAKKLYQKYNVPVGIINSSVGGTPIEAWTSEEGLKEFPSIISTVEKNKDTAYINSLRRPGGGFPRQQQTSQDKGTNGSVPWYDVVYVPKGWKTITVPAFWEDQGVKDLNGVVWYRKEIDVPASMVGKPARVYLGRIIDADVLYINGKQVGRTGSLYTERRYNIPADILKAGKNLFVVRITNNNGKGGFVPDKPYYLFSGKDTVSLVGLWQYKVGEVYIPRTVAGGGGGGVAAQNSPAALYNGMIAPLVNYTIKGFLWYQGESNITRAAEYAQLQIAQIKDWRKKWNLGDLPFLFMQMPNYGDYTYQPGESGWATFRESQTKSLSLPNTGMAVIIDNGEWNDIHPWNKEIAGDRLALVAEKIAYGENIVYSGPLYQSASISGNKITVSFTNTGSGLITGDGEDLSEFAIAGADKKFVPAKAKIEGDKVVVWSDEVSNPMYVRYAWADSPPYPNFYNKEGLPASPFRTDN